MQGVNHGLVPTGFVLLRERLRHSHLWTIQNKHTQKLPYINYHYSHFSDVQFTFRTVHISLPTTTHNLVMMAHPAASSSSKAETAHDVVTKFFFIASGMFTRELLMIKLYYYVQTITVSQCFLSLVGIHLLFWPLFCCHFASVSA